MVWLTGTILWFLVAGFPMKPAEGEFCTDGAGLIRAGHRDRINELVRALEADHRIPIHVVTIRALASHGAQDEGIESFARRLFDDWGIGSARHNYGILLLVAERDRKARIEFGAGWASARNDAAHRIMQGVILPAFRDGEFSEGILLGVGALDAMVRGRPLPTYRNKKKRMGGIVVLILVVLVIFWIVGRQVARRDPLRRAVRKRGGPSWRRLVARRALRELRQGYGTDFWSSGSGGFSGGGGGFSGGGGATGSW